MLYIDIEDGKTMGLTKKVMILFEPDKYKKLEHKPKSYKKSVGALIRDTMEECVISEDKISKKTLFDIPTSQNFDYNAIL